MITRETKFTLKQYREFLYDTNGQVCNIINTPKLDVSDGIEVLRLMLEIMKELMLVDMGYYDTAVYQREDEK
jgi:hypothetical protein